jgi:hypothetical protein
LTSTTVVRLEARSATAIDGATRNATLRGDPRSVTASGGGSFAVSAV